MDVNLRLAWCNYEAAKYAVSHWHYSKTMPKYKTAKIGVWEDGNYKGCVVFSRGATPNLLKPYGLMITEGCELTRIALTKHETFVTEIVAGALGMLKDAFNSMRLVVSFSDPYQGHLGKIYQAGNWVYTGMTSPSKVYKDGSGKIWHGRNLSETGIKKYGIVYLKVQKPSDLEEIKMPGKHRYLYPLDKGMRRQILPLAQPYPKRGQGVQGDTPTVLVGELGSSPRVRSDMTGGEPEMVDS